MLGDGSAEDDAADTYQRTRGTGLLDKLVKARKLGLPWPEVMPRAGIVGVMDLQNILPMAFLKLGPKSQVPVGVGNSAVAAVLKEIRKTATDPEIAELAEDDGTTSYELLIVLNAYRAVFDDTNAQWTLITSRGDTPRDLTGPGDRRRSAVPGSAEGAGHAANHPQSAGGLGLVLQNVEAQLGRAVNGSERFQPASYRLSVDHLEMDPPSHASLTHTQSISSGQHMAPSEWLRKVDSHVDLQSHVSSGVMGQGPLVHCTETSEVDEIAQRDPATGQRARVG